MKKILIGLTITAGLCGGCALLGPSAQEIALMQKIAVLESQKAAAQTPETLAKVEAELAEAKAALAKASAPGAVEGAVTSDLAVDLLKMAGPPGAIAGYLLMAWRRQRANVRALVAGIEQASSQIAEPGFNKETLYKALQTAAEQHTNAAALAKEVAVLKAQIRGAV